MHRLMVCFGILLFFGAACSTSEISTPVSERLTETTVPTHAPTQESSHLATPTSAPTKTVFVTETPIPQEETEPSAEGLIAFYSDRDGNPEIYTVQADGSGLARLTDDSAFDDSPAISPDGSRIVFLTARHDPNPSFPDLKYEIYVMNVDGSNPRRLTNTEAAEDHPSWSPDGGKIIFDTDYDGDGFSEVYTMNPDGTEITRLTFNAANDQFADWSPDGRQIAFSSDRNGNWDIFLMNTDGSNQQALTSSPDWELFPAWSPDGKQIAFNGLIPNSRNTDVYLMDAGGSDVHQLTDSLGFDENPAWSPDGTQIAFQTQRDGNFEIYAMNPDGSQQHPLAAHPTDDLWPSWGPATPRREAQADPWLPKLPDELCVPTETRSCQVLFVLPEQYYAESGRGFPDQFRNLGYTVTIASDAPEVVEVCANTVGFDQPSKNIPVDLSLTEVQVENYDAVIFIGGLGCQDQWQDQNAHRIARDAVEQQKVLGAAGCASTILAYAGVLEGKTAAVCSANPPVKHGLDYCEVLQSQGAICSQELIARDGLIVTAQQKSPYFVVGVIQVILETSPAAPPLSFQKSPQELGMRETFQAALGDLDGDGDLDAVFANPMSNAAAVWLNDGHGTFVDTGQQLTQYGHGVVLADFDHDSDLDTFITCHNFIKPRSIYLNDGNAIFQDTAQDLGDKSISGVDLNLIDLNNDGNLDVHVVYFDFDGLPDKVYLNDGTGTFTDSGLALEEYVIAWGDLDNDGDLDVFVANIDRPHEIWLNARDGNLIDSGLRLGANTDVSGKPSLGDLDGDGDLDVIVGCFSGGAEIWFNQTK
ncbi:MAG: PD40 domain-containing protein [Anaerolineales bacterium]|nr:PD40 domain-containing protein [Anaerolineales bacterium]